MKPSPILRLISAATMLVAAVAVFAVPTPAAASIDGWVRNLRTGVVFTDLQEAVTAANPGDVLKVRGTLGPFTADKDLTLLGPATLTWPCPEAECGPPGRLVWVETGARVVLSDLRITGGSSTWYGGAVHNYGTLVLRGRTAITNSRAEDGGGGVYNEGRLVMRNRSRVSGNSLLFGTGGGILNRGTVVLTDHARVVGNQGFPLGGGIYNDGTLLMSGYSVVACNTAEAGGGVFNAGTMRLSGHASVTGNSASDTGGGIAGEGRIWFSRHWRGTVCGNHPDDLGACA